MNNQTILIIGREMPVIGKLTASLNEIGYRATGSDVVTLVPYELKNDHFDLVAFASSVKPEIKRHLEHVFRMFNPRIVFITALHHSVPLLVEQIKLALNQTLSGAGPVSYINYDINEGCLSLMLRADYPCMVNVNLYRAGIFSGTSKESIHLSQLSSGDHVINFKEKVLSGFGKKFMTISVNDQVRYIRRL